MISLSRHSSSFRPVRPWINPEGAFSPGLLFVLALLLLWLGGYGTELRASGRGENDQVLRRELANRLLPEDLAWTFAVGAVEIPRGAEMDRTVLGSYLRVIQEAIGDAPERHLSREERLRWAEDRLRKEEHRLVQSLEERRHRLDRQRLESGAQAGRFEPYENDSRYADLQKELKTVRGIDPEEVLPPRRVPLQMSQVSPRYSQALRSPGVLAEEMKTDIVFIVGLDILGDDPEETLILTVRAFHKVENRERQVLRVVGRGREIAGMLERSSAELVREVTGVSLASLEVRVQDSLGETDQQGVPEDARIKINGSLAGAGIARERFLLPGPYSVSVLAADGRRAEAALVLEKGEFRSLVVELPPVQPRIFRIETDPPGAQVYEGALWRGVTPLDIALPGVKREFLLRRNGYYDSRLQVSPEGDRLYRRELTPIDRDWAGAVTDSRDSFYRSFGAFALSLSVPIILNGLYDDLGGLFPGGVARSDLSRSEQQHYQDRSDAILAGYYVSVGLSVTLFGNMLWRLSRYIRVSQEYHDR
ncbi:hypothetical protein [Alkalispirochaeta americana]|uniref:hypothetical protein n=1 Tax=Alkalispirochaeta americana TaxID=159291 RepID=UPI001179C236|nr:hypothetical protein [Alkalispirochaeta americana]